MKLTRASNRSGILSLRLATALLVCALIPLLAFAAAPGWWSQRGVVNPNLPPDDYALTNQGQLKNIAKAAVAEFDAQLPGGAGDALHNLVNDWSQPNAQRNDFAPVNLGQLKNVAKPFYDRLITIRYAESYPWTGSANPLDDFAPANIGQVKNLFSFDLLATGPARDTDQDGLPDWWEKYYFGNTAADPNAMATRGDGLTNLQAFQQHLDPLDYYNGIVPQLVVLAGDGQLVKTGGTSARALELLVRRATGEALANAPVTFAVTSGGGLLIGGAAPGTPLSATMTVRSDYSGKVRPTLATVLYRAGDSPESAIVQASAGGAVAQFSLAVTEEGPLEPPSFLRSTANSDGSKLFEWDLPSSGVPAGAFVALLGRNSDGQWQTIALLAPTATSHAGSALELAPFTEFSLRVESPSGGNSSALSNVLGGAASRPSYAVIDLGQAEAEAVASDGTVVLYRYGEWYYEAYDGDYDGAYGEEGYYRNRGGVKEFFGPGFSFGDMNDRGDIIGSDGTSCLVLANDPASVHRTWAPLPGSFLSCMNETGVVFGLVWSQEQISYFERLTKGRSFLSTSPQSFTLLSAFSHIYDTTPFRDPKFRDRTGNDYYFVDMDNHGGAVGSDRNGVTGPDVPLYFGSAPRPSGDPAFWPGALNDDGLVLGTSMDVFKLWEPLAGAFRTLAGPELNAYYPLRISDPPAENPDAPTIILAGSNIIYRTWKDADGVPSAFPIHTAVGASELLPPESGFEDVELIDISNNGLIVANANRQNDRFHAFLLLPVELTVDANRDGEVTLGRDTTSEAKPFRFWVNSDQDDQQESEIVPATSPDHADGQIKSVRDLEDFTRLNIYLGGLHEAITQGHIKVGLKWKNTTGSPSIKVWRNLSPEGGMDYLSDESVAQQHLSLTNPGQVQGSGTYIMPTQFWQDSGLSAENPTGFLLFEAAGEGKGELVMTLHDSSGAEIGTGPGVWLDLKDIKKMYQRQDASGRNQWPGVTFEPYPNASNQTIVFVHGWNQSPDGSSSFAETMFKRLWHRGFKGRYAALRWNTDWSSTFNNVPRIGQTLDAYLADYNDSEHEAWLAGEALKSFVVTLPGASKNVIAHSMGNVVVGSALRRGMTIDNYALLHGAVPASCYDTGLYLEQPQAPGAFGYYYWDSRTPDDDSGTLTRALAYRGQLSAASGNLVNFYLPQDSATTYAWEFNNRVFKPHAGFFYNRNEVDGSRLWKNEFGIRRSLTDAEEAMPYANQSWSKLVGAESRTAGVISSSDNLESEAYSLPGDTKGFKDDHSAEFNRVIQQLKPFYDTLLDKLRVDRNP